MASGTAHARKEEYKYALKLDGEEVGRFRSLKELAAAQALCDQARSLLIGDNASASRRNALQKFYRPVLYLVVNKGRDYFAAAQDGDEKTLGQLIEEGMPVNLVDPATGATALHYVAAYGAREAFLVLLKTGQCDFLLRDHTGRLSSELASVYGNNPAMARLLRYKEIQQAQKKGVQLRRRLKGALR